MVKLYIVKGECPLLLGRDWINIFWRRLAAKVNEHKFIVKPRGTCNKKITEVVR